MIINIIDMKEINKLVRPVLLIFALISFNIYAGNPQRAGQAGASELLINPWARTSGWADANVAGVKGLEGVFSNVAGLAFTEKTELIFTQTSWLQYGSKMFSANDAVSNISSFGFSQKIGIYKKKPLIFFSDFMISNWISCVFANRCHGIHICRTHGRRTREESCLLQRFVP